MELQTHIPSLTQERPILPPGFHAVSIWCPMPRSPPTMIPSYAQQMTTIALRRRHRRPLWKGSAKNVKLRRRVSRHRVAARRVAIAYGRERLRRARHKGRRSAVIWDVSRIARALLLGREAMEPEHTLTTRTRTY